MACGHKLYHPWSGSQQLCFLQPTKHEQSPNRTRNKEVSSKRNDANKFPIKNGNLTWENQKVLSGRLRATEKFMEGFSSAGPRENRKEKRRSTNRNNNKNGNKQNTKTHTHTQNTLPLSISPIGHQGLPDLSSRLILKLGVCFLGAPCSARAFLGLPGARATLLRTIRWPGAWKPRVWDTNIREAQWFGLEVG